MRTKKTSFPSYTKEKGAEISEQVDYIIDGGPLGGKASVLIDLVENKIIER